MLLEKSEAGDVLQDVLLGVLLVLLGDGFVLGYGETVEDVVDHTVAADLVELVVVDGGLVVVDGGLDDSLSVRDGVLVGPDLLLSQFDSLVY